MSNNVIKAEWCFEISRFNLEKTMNNIENLERVELFKGLNKDQRLYLACLKGHYTRLAA